MAERDRHTAEELAELLRAARPRRDPLVVAIAAVLVAGPIGALGWVAVAIGDLKQDVESWTPRSPLCPRASRPRSSRSSPRA